MGKNDNFVLFIWSIHVGLTLQGAYREFYYVQYRVLTHKMN